MNLDKTEKNTGEKNTTPLLKTINDFMRLIKVFMVLVFVAYLFSGITLIKPDEIGVILRMGKIVGNNTEEQIHNPGWLFALPKPFDEVVKIPNLKVLQIGVNGLASKKKKNFDEPGNISSIDPTKEGYCISGDENIFQTSLIVKYHITNPIKLIFGYTNPLNMANYLISDLTVAEMTSVSCQYKIDDILAEEKKELSEKVKNGVQKKLDQMDSGLSIISMEISEMEPPPFLKFDFEDVQSAYVDQYQFINKAKNLNEIKIPADKGAAEKSVNDAMAYKETTIANANANAGKFTQMLEAYKKNPVEVSHEMKSNTIKSIITNSGNLIVFPDIKASQGNVTLLLGMNGSVLTKITTPDGYFEEDD